jgi:hypothetical protein
VSDYLPDLPVSAASRAKAVDLGFDAVNGWSVAAARGQGCPLRGIVVLRPVGSRESGIWRWLVRERCCQRLLLFSNAFSSWAFFCDWNIQCLFL